MVRIHTADTCAFLQWRMRFSAAFNRFPVAARRPGAPVVRRDILRPRNVPDALPPKPAPEAPSELPLDLDQRVRLVGEW